MKVLIEIPEGIYKTLCKNSSADIVRQAVIDGTLLPQNATNGDVIKATFPNIEIVGHLHIPEKKIVVKLYPEDCTHDFDLDWWNAPYKAESEDKDDKE